MNRSRKQRPAAANRRPLGYESLESRQLLAPLPFASPPPPIPPGDAALPYITAAEVDNLLSRAAGATSTEDAIIAIVDRGGNILGVRMEQGVLDNIPDEATRVFAIDG